MSDDRRRSRETTYRRHEDAGRIPVNRVVDENVVDLPPLYTDVPRDETTLASGPSGEEGESRSPASYEALTRSPGGA
jgi:hypothetical protein